MREIGSRTGSVKWFSIRRGFGFITLDDGKDVFLHHASIVYQEGRCEHQRGICARAMSLLSDVKREEESTRQKRYDFATPRFEALLKGEPVSFRLFETPRGVEARSVKRV